MARGTSTWPVGTPVSTKYSAGNTVGAIVGAGGAAALVPHGPIPPTVRAQDMSCSPPADAKGQSPGPCVGSSAASISIDVPISMSMPGGHSDTSKLIPKERARAASCGRAIRPRISRGGCMSNDNTCCTGIVSEVASQMRDCPEVARSGRPGRHSYAGHGFLGTLAAGLDAEWATV